MKTVLWFIGTWAASLTLAVLATGLGAAAAGKAVSQGERAVMLLIPLQVLFFLAGTALLWKLAAAIPHRWPLILVHALLQLGTAAVIAFGTLVAFNR